MATVDVDSLTDSEIRLKFSELGCPVGPVTSTTRKTLLKKLKALLEKAGSRSELNDSNTETLKNDRNERSARIRRNSLPRTGNKSPSRRKSPARTNASVVSNDISIGSASPESNPLSSPSLNESRRSTRSVFTQDSSVYSSPTYLCDYETEASSLLNHGSSIEGSNNARGSFGLGPNENFRSRFKESIRDVDFNLSSSSPPQSFSSDFVKRLAASRNTQRTVGGITSKLLDVKESDDEDTGPTPVYAKFSQSGPRGSSVTNIKNITRTSPTEGWLPFDSPVSTLLVITFLLFFTIIGVTYVNMHSADTNLTPHSGINFPSCSNIRSPVPGMNCIKDEDKDAMLKFFNIIYKEIYDNVTNGPCGGVKPEPITFPELDIISTIINRDRGTSIWEIEKNLKNLKVLLNANPKWNITSSSEGITLRDPPVSYYCLIFDHVYMALVWSLKLILVCIVGYIGYVVARWWMLRESRYKEELYKLVSNIIDTVSKGQTPNSVIPISHVRDQLIAPKDRTRMNKLWEDALKFLESDSRLRREVQVVEGEEFLVWRWLASNINSSSKRKVWQGQAFATIEGSVNSLAHSPTPCLKIRHMFDPTREEGDDWVKTVVNAILEKCTDNKAKILHIVVDKQSQEGCVYMKCATPLDAGIAYRALHGSWFDSTLVTVKYIREKRYLERFPESAHCVQPLQPTDTLKD